MKREDIEKAAKVWAKDEITKSRIERGKRAFKAGANWRINSVWHDAKDVPQPFRAFVILHDTENDFMMLTQHSITCDSDYNVIYQENDNMIAWAYIEDLIPLIRRNEYVRNLRIYISGLFPLARYGNTHYLYSLSI